MPSVSNITGGFIKRVMPTIADKRIHDNIDAEHVPDFSKFLLSLSSRVVDGSIAFIKPAEQSCSSEGNGDTNGMPCE